MFCQRDDLLTRPRTGRSAALQSAPVPGLEDACMCCSWTYPSVSECANNPPSVTLHHLLGHTPWAPAWTPWKDYAVRTDETPPRRPPFNAGTASVEGPKSPPGRRHAPLNRPLMPR